MTMLHGVNEPELLTMVVVPCSVMLRVVATCLAVVPEVHDVPLLDLTVADDLHGCDPDLAVVLVEDVGPMLRAVHVGLEQLVDALAVHHADVLPDRGPGGATLRDLAGEVG